MIVCSVSQSYLMHHLSYYLRLSVGLGYAGGREAGCTGGG